MLLAALLALASCDKQEDIDRAYTDYRYDIVTYLGQNATGALFEYLGRDDSSSIMLQSSVTVSDVKAQQRVLLRYDFTDQRGGASRDIIESQLHDFQFLGVENLLALRGDCITGEKRFVPDPDGYTYASQLVEAIEAFSKTRGYDFCVGVGAYPEKHFEAPNLETDIENLKKKVDAGADYIVTQMFFDNKVFYEFCDKCRAAGITVPIIPGLKPLSSARQISLLPEAFSIDIPLELSSEMEANKDNKEACYQIGKRWCSEQCRDLLAHGCKTVHFYTMGKADNIVDILRENF
jgi:methylenetetrahydrofolate reductase (NADPH)